MTLKSPLHISKPTQSPSGDIHTSIKSYNCGNLSQEYACIDLKYTVENTTEVYFTQCGIPKDTPYCSSKQNFRMCQFRFQQAHLTVHMTVFRSKFMAATGRHFMN